MTSGKLSDVYRSADLGASWLELSLAGDSDGGITPSGQGKTHFSFVADVNDPNIIYIGGDTQPEGEPQFPNRIGAVNWTGRLFRGDARIACTGGLQ